MDLHIILIMGMDIAMDIAMDTLGAVFKFGPGVV